MDFDTAIAGHSFFMTHHALPPVHTHLPGAVRATNSPVVCGTGAGGTHCWLFLHPPPVLQSWKRFHKVKLLGTFPFKTPLQIQRRGCFWHAVAMPPFIQPPRGPPTPAPPNFQLTGRAHLQRGGDEGSPLRRLPRHLAVTGEGGQGTEGFGRGFGFFFRRSGGGEPTPGQGRQVLVKRRTNSVFCHPEKKKKRVVFASSCVAGFQLDTKSAIVSPAVNID